MGGRQSRQDDGGADRAAFIDEAGVLHQAQSGYTRRDAPPPAMSIGQLEVEQGGGSGGRIQQFFPEFRWKSVIGITIAVQLVVYVVSCLIPPAGYLQPKPAANWRLGAGDHEAMSCFSLDPLAHWIELRRLVVPIFLHGGLLHILMNLYFEFSSGPGMERLYGPGRFALLFFVSGICGNLLSGAMYVHGVGASTACYGIIGAQLAALWVRWGEFDEGMKVAQKQRLMQFCGILLLWELMNWKTIDHFGHGGGLLGGFALATALDASASPQKRRASGLFLTTLIAATMTRIFVFYRSGLDSYCSRINDLY